MWTNRFLGILALSSALLGACTETKNDESYAPYRAQLQISQGVQLQGIQLQGIQLQGIQLQGIQLQGIQLQGIQLQGLQLQGLQLQGLQLQGIQLQGLQLQGVDLRNVTLDSIAFDGSLLKGKLSNGMTISGRDFIGLVVEFMVRTPTPGVYQFRLDNVTLDTTSNSFGDVWLYHISVKAPTDSAYRSICMDAAGIDHELVPILGAYWDEATGNRIDNANAITLACTNGVIAKCTRVGYRPWATGKICRKPGKNCDTLSLKDHHQACTRMYRADYCGDGKPFTKDGTIIDIFDYLDPPVQLREEAWTFEARWQPTGAMCLSKPRHPELGFTGKCKDSKGKERTLRPCNPYEEDKGLVVSTFNGTGATGIKGDGKN